MKISLAALLAILCALPLYGAEETTTKVVWRAHKDHTNAETVDKVKAKVGQYIEIDWHFAVVPEQIPSTNDAKSSDPSVGVLGIASILPVPTKAGTGVVAAGFRAEKEGSATLTFTMKNKGTTVVLKCEVEVSK